MTRLGNRRDIPYAQRMLLEKFNTVREHRDDAARTALKIGCVALNNTESMGYLRIVRFAREQQKLTDEYYADPEVQEKHLNDRLRQMAGYLQGRGRTGRNALQQGLPHYSAAECGLLGELK